MRLADGRNGLPTCPSKPRGVSLSRFIWIYADFWLLFQVQCQTFRAFFFNILLPNTKFPVGLKTILLECVYWACCSRNEQWIERFLRIFFFLTISVRGKSLVYNICTRIFVTHRTRLADGRNSLPTCPSKPCSVSLSDIVFYLSFRVFLASVSSSMAKIWRIFLKRFVAKH